MQKEKSMIKYVMKLKSLSLLVVMLVQLLTLVQAELLQGNEEGANEYINSCAACHGIDGKGNGPMVDQLIKQPKDLTILSQENGGSFPETVIYQIIDGRRVNLSHGPQEMPIWGMRFRITEGNEEAVDARISNIIKFIEKFQI